MQVFRDMGQRIGIASELLRFLWQAKVWWMIPIVVVLLLIGLLVVFGTTTGLGPFAYTIF